MTRAEIQARRDEIEEWLDNPTTQLIHRYYQDSRAELIDNYARTIGSGGTVDMESQIRDGESCRVLEQLSKLEYEDIEDFYNESSVRDSLG